MNDKEVAEIRRRFRPDQSNITHIRGCCVNESGEILTQFDQSLALCSQEESEKFLSLLKRTLSGTLGKNLLDIAFETAQVAYGEEHKLLTTLKSSALKDDEAVQAFFQKVIQSVKLEGNYLILLAHDSYDVPYRAKDGGDLQDASSEVFSYILCSICPVKLTKSALSYLVHRNEFRNSPADWLVSAPELGFLFPTFDDRSANLYNALYYTKDPAESHEPFVDAVFKQSAPMPAALQKETFQSLLGETLAEDCRYDVVQAVHEGLCVRMEEHKVNKETQPLVLSKGEVKKVLENCGVEEAHLEAFAESFDAQFGAEATLSPQNLIDARQFELKTADVTIKVNPLRSDLVETRIIQGTRYILIRVEEGVEVNGVPIQITPEAD